MPSAYRHFIVDKYDLFTNLTIPDYPTAPKCTHARLGAARLALEGFKAT